MRKHTPIPTLSNFPGNCSQISIAKSNSHKDNSIITHRSPNLQKWQFLRFSKSRYRIKNFVSSISTNNSHQRKAYLSPQLMYADFHMHTKNTVLSSACSNAESEAAVNRTKLEGNRPNYILFYPSILPPMQQQEVLLF